MRRMWTILGAILASAVTTIVITARFRKEIMDYVETVCDTNIKAIKDYADVSERYVNKLVKDITHNMHE